MENSIIKHGKTIRDLVSELKRYLPGIDYQASTIARLNADWNKLISYADAHGVEEFSMDLGRTFVWETCGAMLGDKDASHNLNRAIHMLADFERYGMVFKSSKETLKKFSQEFATLFEAYLKYLRKAGTAEGSIRTWRGRLFRFDSFLRGNGIDNFCEIGAQHILTYVESLSCYATGTIGSTIRILRRLFDYAIENGYHTTNHMNVLPDVRRMKSYRLPTVFTASEVERILAVADRDNSLGKRNYAILILVAKMGLRISDVRKLCFDNINWLTKTISIVQQKTGVPLDLPLLDDVGWAIIDYLQHGRPKTDCQNIFVRHNAPYDELADSMRRIVLNYTQKAGIEVPQHRPIGMHTFRHSIATTMLKNGAKYTEIAQTLGHAAPESAQTYLSLDETQLRQCALEVNF